MSHKKTQKIPKKYRHINCKNLNFEIIKCYPLSFAILGIQYSTRNLQSTLNKGGVGWAWEMNKWRENHVFNITFLFLFFAWKLFTNLWLQANKSYNWSLKGESLWALKAYPYWYFNSSKKSWYFTRSKIGWYFTSSKIPWNFTSSKTCRYFTSSTIGWYFPIWKIGWYFTNSKIEYCFTSGKIGWYFTSSEIGSYFISSKIGWYFTSSKIGCSFTSNNIGWYFTSSKIGCYFTSSEVGWYFTSSEMVGISPVARYVDILLVAIYLIYHTISQVAR